MPAPLNAEDNIGEGTFYCLVPPGRTRSTTIVWNPADIPLEIGIMVNGREITRQIQPSQRASIEVPVDGTRITMRFRGDRRLVLLQTDFQ